MGHLPRIVSCSSYRASLLRQSLHHFYVRWRGGYFSSVRDGPVAMTDYSCSIPGRQIKAVARLAFRGAMGKIVLRGRRMSSEVGAEEEYETNGSEE